MKTHRLRLALVAALNALRRTSARPLPDNAKLAGVSLRTLLDDPCGPGAVLRDRLTYSSTEGAE